MKPLSTRFSSNWNGKLGCKFFTTIRRFNPQKFKEGSIHEIWLGDTQLGKAQVYKSHSISLKQVSDYIGFLDTGYNGRQTRDILKKMHKNIDEESLFSLVIFCWVKRYIEPHGIDKYTIEVGKKTYCLPHPVYSLIQELSQENEELKKSIENNVH